MEVCSSRGVAITGWGCVRQTKANARLIAAAPELLEVLREMVACADREVRPLSSLIHQCKLTIAKAEGRS